MAYAPEVEQDYFVSTASEVSSKDGYESDVGGNGLVSRQSSTSEVSVQSSDYRYPENVENSAAGYQYHGGYRGVRLTQSEINEIGKLPNVFARGYQPSDARHAAQSPSQKFMGARTRSEIFELSQYPGFEEEDDDTRLIGRDLRSASEIQDFQGLPSINDNNSGASWSSSGTYYYQGSHGSDSSYSTSGTYYYQGSKGSRSSDDSSYTSDSNSSFPSACSGNEYSYAGSSDAGYHPYVNGPRELHPTESQIEDLKNVPNVFDESSSSAGSLSDAGYHPYVNGPRALHPTKSQIEDLKTIPNVFDE